MKKIVFLWAALALLCQPADAQLFKKLFKKKAKTEKKTETKADGIDDAQQLALADITTADNANNRNAFLGIPVGIKADRFEQQLFSLNFKEQKDDGPHTGKSYIYEGVVYGQKAVVTLAVSEQTARVYAVDVQESTMYNKRSVVKRFNELKSLIAQTYGHGYVDNQGEGYTVQSRLGTVNLHFERSSGVDVYTIGFALDDAKAYQMAYREMDDKEHEAAPRALENGLAVACWHTDLVGLGVCLMQNRTVKGAQSVLNNYDYTVGKVTAKALPATFSMDGYQAAATLTRRKQAITAIQLVADDDVEEVCHDLQTYGFTTKDQKTWLQGKMTAVVTTDKQGRVVVSFK